MLAWMRRKRNPFALLVGMQTISAILENSMEVPQKVKNRTLVESSSQNTGYLPKEYKNSSSKGYMHPDVLYSSIIYKSEVMEAAQVSINSRMGKADAVYIQIQWNITQPSKRMKSCHLQ